MKVNLVCSSRNEKVLIEIFKSRQISLDKSATISFVERGHSTPESGVSVLFNYFELNDLIDFMDSFQVSATKNHKLELLTGKKDNSFEVIKPDMICFFMSDGNYVYCQTEVQRLEINKKLYELESSYADMGFIRINKSHVVNILKVNEIVPWFGGRLLLSFKGIKDEIPVPRHYVSGFKEFLGL
ncbi:MAG: LytTR family transcriptional regulator [Deltaproteobacteria bacterium]|nr:LytTR family transcriptional regulator [Deltaproteobacteria bacterium]